MMGEVCPKCGAWLASCRHDRVTPADPATPQHYEVDERWIDDYVEHGMNAIERCLWVNSPLFKLVVEGWNNERP